MRLLQKKIYIVQLDAAIKRGDEILWTDESYANVCLGFGRSYRPKDAPYAEFAKKAGAGLGSLGRTRASRRSSRRIRTSRGAWIAVGGS